MCGIAGFIGPVTEEAEVFARRMMAPIESRGPDSQKILTVGANAILLNTRLRVTDALNAEADMPFTSADGRYVITFNGEIYNHLALRRRIPSYRFRTQSDTETILACYQAWGQGCVHHFEGMFAFCIYDTLENTAFLAVDPTGQKPLYYAYAMNGLWFSSDIRSLTRAGLFRPELNRAALTQAAGIYFIFGRQTHIKQVQKLESGCSLLLSRDSITQRRYYQLPVRDSEEREIVDIEKTIDDLRNAIRSSCRKTFSLEVPYAHLLSGGIDSSLIVALAREEGLALDTFSIGFDQRDRHETRSVEYNEFEYSSFVSEYFKTNHTKIILSPADYVSALKNWASICNEPHGAPESVSLLCLFSAIRDRGFRVAFCGSGPDEIFDGYAHGYKLSTCTTDDVAKRYFQSFGGNSSIDLKKLIPGSDPEKDFIEAVSPYLAIYKERNLNGADLSSLIDYHGIYPVCEFRQIDACSMAYGVEVRSPLAEKELVDMAFSIPASLKHRQGIEKWIFKEAARGILPDFIIDRKKAGFPIPSSVFLSPEFETLAAPIIEQGSGLDRSGMFDLAYLRTLWNDRRPEIRNFFYRLFIMDAIISRDMP